jgi:D-threonine aldolase
VVRLVHLYDRDRDGAPTKAFEPSLFVWATVMSRPAQDRAIVDAGLKALAFDSGPPLVPDEPAASYERASDEHGRLGISGATNPLNIGDAVRLIPAIAIRPLPPPFPPPRSPGQARGGEG